MGEGGTIQSAGRSSDGLQEGAGDRGEMGGARLASRQGPQTAWVEFSFYHLVPLCLGQVT